MSDFTPNKLSFDVNGFMSEFKNCVNIAIDELAGHMHDVLCTVISQCSEAANVMIIETQKNVKEISREIENDHATIEVGVDEGAIKGGEQAFVRVMVTLHGNGIIETKPGQSTWKKHVNSKGQSGAKMIYRIPELEQQDHSGLMMLSFEHDMNKHIKDFFNTLITLLDTIDYSKYVIVS